MFMWRSRKIIQLFLCKTYFTNPVPTMEIIHPFFWFCIYLYSLRRQYRCFSKLIYAIIPYDIWSGTRSLDITSIDSDLASSQSRGPCKVATPSTQPRPPTRSWGAIQQIFFGLLPCLGNQTRNVYNTHGTTHKSRTNTRNMDGLIIGNFVSRHLILCYWLYLYIFLIIIMVRKGT